MKKNFWQLVKVAPALVGVSMLAVSPAQADDTQIINQLDNYSAEGFVSTQDQVTSVSQLRDVSPTDWAYEALRSLVERYGCIVGYPDRTFRGNRALSRYEFAAGLNACMQQMERLIAGSESVLREDVAKLQRLVSEFEAELAALGARVDNLEGRVAFLEDHQFSTTTKLQGEVILALTQEFLNDGNQAVLQDRVRLALNTSFTGKDTLITRLQAGNAQAFNLDDRNSETGSSPLTTLAQNVDLTFTGGNDVSIDWIAYYTPISIGENSEVQVYLAGFNGIHSDYAPTLNPYFEDFDGGNGAISTFATESPIYRIGFGSGLGLGYEFEFLGGRTFNVSAGYLASTAENPNDGNGLFNGDYAALGQISTEIVDGISLGLTYVHSYNQNTPIFSGIVGTEGANFGFNDGNIFDGKTKSNTYGAQVAWRLSDRISLSGFFSYSDIDLIGEGDDEVWSYGGGVAFPDFGKEGSVLGIFGGVQPYSGNLIGSNRNTDLPIHVEAFYKYQLTDNISITPGVVWITSPEQRDDTEDALIGTLRTTFTF